MESNELTQLSYSASNAQVSRGILLWWYAENYQL